MKMIAAIVALFCAGCVTHSVIQAKTVHVTIKAETKLNVKGLPLP